MYQGFKHEKDERYFDQLLEFRYQHMVEIAAPANWQTNSKKGETTCPIIA